MITIGYNQKIVLLKYGFYDIKFHNMDSVCYFIVNLLSYLLPVRLAHLITRLAANVLFHTVYKNARRNVENNLMFIFGDKLKRWKRKQLIFETFQSFAFFIYEFAIMRKINQKTYRNFVNPVGFENVERALEKGKGVIIVTGHLGNWEWGAALLTYLGYHAIVIATRFKNPFVTRYYYNQRTKQGLEVIYLEDAVKKTLKKLKSNGIVAIVGDRDYTNQGTEISFFGKMTRFPTGALLLGLRTGAPVIPCFAIRRGMCKYDVIFSSPIKMMSKGYREEEFKEDMSRWAKILEGYIRKYPSQWYRFQPFWEPEKV